MVKKFRFIAYCIGLQLISVGIVAQEKTVSPWEVGLHYHHGFLLNHSPARTDVASANLTNVWGLEATIQWHTLGQRNWHKWYNFPKWGMSLLYYNIDDRIIKGQNVAWGNGIAWLIHKSMRIFKTSFMESNIRLGTGFGYFTKPYNEKDNPGNLWVSAPLSSSLHLNLEVLFKLSPQYQLVAAGTFTHFSNGAIMMPNLGVNFPTLNVGLRFTPHPERIIYKIDTVKAELKKHFIHFSGSFGIKVLPDYGTTYYPNWSASAHYGRRLGKVSKMLVGLDLFADYSLAKDSIVKAQNQDFKRTGLFIGHELMFGRLGFITGFGVYLYKGTADIYPVYIKTGLRYHFMKNVYGAWILRTHYGQADTFEWTLGCTI